MAKIPLTQLAAMKLIVNQAYDNMGLQSTQILGPILDGIMRNTPEGRAFVRLAASEGVKRAVAERDGPFGDYSQGRPKTGPANAVSCRGLRVKLKQREDRMHAFLADDPTVIARLLDHIDHKTTDLSEGVWLEPVENYTSQERFQAEITRVLRRTPTPFCPSAALPEVGSYVARERR